MAGAPAARADKVRYPGVLERHEKRCGLRKGRRRCSCQPSYRARVRAGGRRVERTFQDLAEAIRFVDEAREAVRRGCPVSLAQRIASPSLRESAVAFVHCARGGVALGKSRRPLSADRVRAYESSLRLHVLPHVDEPTGLELADLPVEAIGAREIQRMVDAVHHARSAETARGAHAALSAVLRDLYRRGLHHELPPRVELPPPSPRRDLTITLDEADRLLEAARADDHARERSLMAPLVAVLGGGGLRLGEALALRWGPAGVDLASEPPRIVVARESTKTDAGARDVPIEAMVVQILRQHRLATGRLPDGALVFAHEDDPARPLSRDGRIRTSWRRVVEAAGLPIEVTPHVLRHSHATWLDEGGFRSHDLSLRLGHADVGFTQRRYVHASRVNGYEAVTILGRLRSAGTPSGPRAVGETP